MKKTFLIILKIMLTGVWILGWLISLTEIKLSGFNIGSWKVSSEQAQMFVETAGDYLFWIISAIGIFIIWKKWIKK